MFNVYKLCLFVQISSLYLFRAVACVFLIYSYVHVACARVVDLFKSFRICSNALELLYVNFNLAIFVSL